MFIRSSLLRRKRSDKGSNPASQVVVPTQLHGLNRCASDLSAFGPEWLAVDLDGTLARSLSDYSDPMRIGAPIPLMVEKVKRVLDSGMMVKIMTARMADEEHAEEIAAAIAAWTNKHLGVALSATCRKDPMMVAIWDDKTRQVVPDTGKAASRPRSFLLTARPTEKKIEILTQQMGLTPEQVEACIAADPSPNQSDYVQWIAKQVKKGLLRLPEDGDRIKEQITRFVKAKRAPGFSGEKDINKYSPASLYQAFGQALAPTQVSNKEKDREAVAKGSRVIIKTADLLIREVTDARALSLLSGGTNWCTAQEGTAKEYLERGPSYVIFYEGSAYGQLHPSSGQFMDRTDVSFHDVFREDEEIGRYGYDDEEFEEEEGEKPKTANSFIFDDVAREAVRLLAKKVPAVAEWFAPHDAPEDEVRQHLSRPRATGIDKIRLAILNKQPLSDEEEKTLLYDADDELLTRYGLIFHRGAPWAPLENRLLDARHYNPGPEFITYATKFSGGKWPKGERFALEHVDDERWYEVLQAYALSVMGGRWEALERAIAESQEPAPGHNYNRYDLAIDYCINVLHKPWPNTDDHVVKDMILRALPNQLEIYAKNFYPEGWDGLRDRLLFDLKRGLANGNMFFKYIESSVKKRDPKIEAAILEGGQAYSGVIYARKFIPGRWPELEEVLTKGLKARLYAQSLDHQNVWAYLQDKKERIPALEATLLEMLPTTLDEGDIPKRVDRPTRQMDDDDIDYIQRAIGEYCEAVRSYGHPWAEGEERITSRNAVQEALMTVNFEENHPYGTYVLSSAQSICAYLERIAARGQGWPEGEKLVKEAIHTLLEKAGTDYGLEKRLNGIHASLAKNKTSSIRKHAMQVTVPEAMEDHFWEEPPAGSEEFWALRWPVRAKVGDVIVFNLRKKPVAEAVISRIEKPGQSECETTGKYRNMWKVYWTPESFKKLDTRGKSGSVSAPKPRVGGKVIRPGDALTSRKEMSRLPDGAVIISSHGLMGKRAKFTKSGKLWLSEDGPVPSGCFDFGKSPSWTHVWAKEGKTK